jgi:hypothetical protein
MYYFFEDTRCRRYTRKRYCLLTVLYISIIFPAIHDLGFIVNFMFLFLQNTFCCPVAPTLTLKSRGVSLSWISEYAEFPLSHSQITKSFIFTWISDVAEFLSCQVSLLSLGLVSFTRLNDWIRWILLYWVSEFAKFLYWLLACWVSLSWMSEYAESYSPESLRSQSFSYDSWHAEFHSPKCMSKRCFTLLNLWVSKVYLMTPSLSHDSCWVSLSLMSEYAEFHSPESHSALGLFPKNPSAHVRRVREDKELCALCVQTVDIVRVKCLKSRVDPLAIFLWLFKHNRILISWFLKQRGLEDL